MASSSTTKSHTKNFRSILIYIGNHLKKEAKGDLIFLKDLPAKVNEECKKDFSIFWEHMLNRTDDFKYNEDDPTELFEDLVVIDQQSVASEVRKMYESLKEYKLIRSHAQSQASVLSHQIPENNIGSGFASPGQSQGVPPGITVPRVPSASAAQGGVSMHAVQHQIHSSYRSTFGSRSGGGSPTMAMGRPASGPTGPSLQHSPGSPSQFRSAIGPSSSSLQSNETLHIQPHNVSAMGIEYPGQPGTAGGAASENHSTLQYQVQPSSSGGANVEGLKSTEGLPTMSMGHLALGHDLSLPHSPASPSDHSPLRQPSSLRSKEPSHINPRTVALEHTLQPIQPASAQGAERAIAGIDPYRVQPSGGGLNPHPSHQSSLVSPRTQHNMVSQDRLLHSPAVAASPTGTTNSHELQGSSTAGNNLLEIFSRFTLADVEARMPTSPPELPPLNQGDVEKDHGPTDCGNTALEANVVQDAAAPEKNLSNTSNARAHEQEFDIEKLLRCSSKSSENLRSEPAKTLRKYQTELAALGKEGCNYIICAPTGSGKTITAANVCHERMLEATGQAAQFKAIFIVPTRHLKKQQREAFQDIFAPGTVASLGDGQLFGELFNRGNVRVLMITAQVLVNALKQGEFKLSEVSMLIFDECHHTTLNHPYNEIMRRYLKDKKEVIDQKGSKKWPIGFPYGGLPQVIGLTASIGTGRSDDAHSHIVTLCANLDSSKVKVVEDKENVQELERENKPPEKDTIVSTPVRQLTSAGARFIEILETVMKEIEQHVLRECLVGSGVSARPVCLLYGNQDYECWIAGIRSYADVRYPELHICAEYLFHLNVALMVYEDLRAEDAFRSIETFKSTTMRNGDLIKAGRHCRLIYEKFVDELKQLVGDDDPLSNPKLLALQEQIKEIYKEVPESKVIVLARTRFATSALLDFIKTNAVLRGLGAQIRPVRIVGQSKELDDGQTQARQEAALDHFRSERANLLVATDIVQEGLNIPACNAIIRYNFVSNEIGTVQSKGRARAKNSKCYLIVERNSLNEGREYKNRKQVAEMATAIELANRMPKGEWLSEVAKRQLTILDQIQKKEEERRAHLSGRQPSDYRLLCKGCDAFICRGSDLERRLSNYTCVDSSIEERTRVRHLPVREFRESKTVGILLCKRCENQLGQSIHFKRNGIWKPGCNLTVKSLKFSYQDSSETKTFAKWKKVDFEIASEQ